MTETLLIGADKSIGHIVRWAYACHDSLDSTPPAAMFRQGARMTLGNAQGSRLDYIAEAAMVLKLLDNLPTQQIRWLVATLYGLRRDAYSNLIQALADMAEVHTMIAEELIAGWIRNDRPSINALADKCGIARREAERQYNQAQGMLRGWDRMATEMLRVAFQSRGWIE